MLTANQSRKSITSVSTARMSEQVRLQSPRTCPPQYFTCRKNLPNLTGSQTEELLEELGLKSPTRENRSYNLFRVENNDQNDIPENIKKQKEFLRNTENTHDSPVQISVLASIKRLKERYFLKKDEPLCKGKILSNRDNILLLNKEILNLVYNSHLSKKHKNLILEWFKTTYREEASTLISGSGLNLSEILLLVWQGICDKNCMKHVRNGIPFSDADIYDRKIILLLNICEAQTGNGASSTIKAACATGIINNFILSLDLCHVDVVIDRLGKSPEELKRAARVTRDNFLFKLVKDVLLSLAAEDTIRIFLNWGNDENYHYKKFIEILNHDDSRALKKHLDKKMFEDYQELKKSIRDELLSEIFDGIGLEYYLNRPAIHPQLCKFLESIEQSSSVPKVKTGQRIYAELKEEISSIIQSENIYTLEEMLENISNIIIDKINTEFTELLTNEILHVIKKTDFNSYFAKRRLELNKKLPNHVYSIYKLAIASLASNKIENNLFNKYKLYENAVQNIVMELEDAKNVACWTYLTRSQITTSFYANLNATLPKF